MTLLITTNKGYNHEQYRRRKQGHKNDQIIGAMGLGFFTRRHKWLVLTCVILLNSGCLHDNTRDRHAAKMFANILVTAEAQIAEGAPPIQQTANAIQEAAKAGLKVMGFELER